MTPLHPPSVKAYPRCHSLAADPKGRFLYALSTREFSHRDCLVSQFQIGLHGALTPLSPATVPVSSAGSGPSLIVVRPDGRGAYVLGRAGYSTAFRIEPDGRLMAAEPIRAENLGLAGPSARAVFHPTLPLLFLSTQGPRPGPDQMTIGKVDIFTLPPSVSVLGRPLQTLNMDGNTPLGVFFAHTGRFAYIPHNWNRVPKTSEYRVAENGKLVPLSPPNTALPVHVSAAFVDPASRFLHLVSCRADVSRASVRLSRQAIGTDGRLERLFAQTLPMHGPVADANFDPSRRFLYLLTGNGVRPFRVKPDGSVAPLATSIRAGRGPLAMIFVGN